MEKNQEIPIQQPNTEKEYRIVPVLASNARRAVIAMIMGDPKAKPTSEITPKESD